MKRIRIVYDEESSQNQESPHGTPLPESEELYAGNEVMELLDPKDDPTTGIRRKLPYAEYIKYQGNPDRHVVIGMIVQTRCPHCGAWHDGTSVWGYDFMDDDPFLMQVQVLPEPGETYTPEQIEGWPDWPKHEALELFRQAETPNSGLDN